MLSQCIIGSGSDSPFWQLRLQERSGSLLQPPALNGDLVTAQQSLTLVVSSGLLLASLPAMAAVCHRSHLPLLPWLALTALSILTELGFFLYLATHSKVSRVSRHLTVLIFVFFQTSLSPISAFILTIDIIIIIIQVTKKCEKASERHFVEFINVGDGLLTSLSPTTVQIANI